MSKYDIVIALIAQCIDNLKHMSGETKQRFTGTTITQ